MEKIILALLVFINACGSRNYIDPELQKYVNIVLSYCEFDNCKLSDYVDVIQFGDVQSVGGVESDNGYCSKESVIRDDVQLPISQIITIDKEKFHSFRENEKINLIAHELGHCNWHAAHADSGLMSKHAYLNHENPEKQFLEFYDSEVLKIAK